MKKQKITIQIEAEWGSDFQKEVALDSLKVIIEAWSNFRDKSHKKNKITYKIKGIEDKKNG